jgi:signal transduction histidine kinase/ActR/RegA family two-component response regulator
MHTLLERQLRKAGFSPDTLPTDLATWKAFLNRVELFYHNADRDRKLYEVNGLSSAPSHPPVQVVPQPSRIPIMVGVELQQIMAAMHDGLCAFDLAGTLIFCNPAAERYLGMPFSELQQQGSRLLERFTLHHEATSQIPFSCEQLIALISQGVSFHDSNATLHQATQILPVACEFNPLRLNEQIIGFVLLFIDISDLKSVEADLIAAKVNAEKASSAKSLFLSSMSHELRTPMNAILGYGELLKDDLSAAPENFDTDLTVDLQQYVANILQAGWHLLELINKVLDLTRIEAGRLEVTIEKVELIDLIKECCNLISPLAEKRDITVINEMETSPPSYALADRARLKQVLINLLSNAIKYNREKGTIAVRLLPTVPDLPETLRLEVQDTGIGLNTEQKGNVFEPFTRFSGLNLVEGTGIGLTITKRLLEIMDGKIGVESELGVGSTFFVDLPTGEMTDCPLDLSSGKHKYTLLYVEDSRTNVSLVAQILKVRPEVALMSAHTGEMGLELAHLHHPDAILLDINLPGMDGFEVLKQLRLAEDTQHIPVLALTAMDNANNLARGKEAGFLDYIVKPLDIKQFLKTVDQAFLKSAAE